MADAALDQDPWETLAQVRARRSALAAKEDDPLDVLSQVRQQRVSRSVEAHPPTAPADLTVTPPAPAPQRAPLSSISAILEGGQRAPAQPLQPPAIPRQAPMAADATAQQRVVPPPAEAEFVPTPEQVKAADVARRAAGIPYTSRPEAHGGNTMRPAADVTLADQVGGAYAERGVRDLAELVKPGVTVAHPGMTADELAHPDPERVAAQQAKDQRDAAEAETDLERRDAHPVAARVGELVRESPKFAAAAALPEAVLPEVAAGGLAGTALRAARTAGVFAGAGAAEKTLATGELPSPKELGSSALMGAGAALGGELLGALWGEAVGKAKQMVAGHALAPADPAAFVIQGVANNDPFSALGLDRATASEADVKTAYRDIATQFHPDQNPAPHAAATFDLATKAKDAALDDLARRAPAASPIAQTPAAAPTPALSAVAEPAAPPAEPVAPVPPETSPAGVEIPDFIKGTPAAPGEEAPVAASRAPTSIASMADVQPGDVLRFSTQDPTKSAGTMGDMHGVVLRVMNEPVTGEPAAIVSRADNGAEESVLAKDFVGAARFAPPESVPAEVPRETGSAAEQTEPAGPVAPRGWRSSLSKARVYADALGVPHDGLTLTQLVPAIEAKAPPSNLDPADIIKMRTADIHADPTRFQFKQLGPEGVSKELKGVNFWNAKLAGVVSVWLDPADGKVYVVNGHHRLELAKRLGVGKLNVQMIDAPTAERARAEGAYMNIAEGRGTKIDVAKFMRDEMATPEDIAATGVSLRGDLARGGINLAALAPDIFNDVAAGKIPENVASAIGEQLPESHDLQRQALSAITKSGKRLSEGEAREVAAQIKAAGSEKVSQETLFGTESQDVSLVVPRAQLANALLARFGRAGRILGFVAKEGRAEVLEKAGSHIDVEQAAKGAEASGQVEEIFRRLYTRSGPVAQMMTEGARRIAHGEKAAVVAREIDPPVAAAVSAEIARGGSGVSADEPQRGESPAAGSAAAAGTENDAEGVVRDSQDPDQGGMFAFNDPGQLDMFGAHPAPESSQEGFFGEREGTAAARSLSQTEAAARSELESLRQRYSIENNPGRRATLAAAIAERERLVNRDKKISADELQVRAAAGEGHAFEAPDGAPRRRQDVGESFEPPAPAATVEPSQQPAPASTSASATAAPKPAAGLAGDVRAGVEEIRQKAGDLADNLRLIAEPATRSEGAMVGALHLRKMAAQRALRNEQAIDALKGYARYFNRHPELGDDWTDAAEGFKDALDRLPPKLKESIAVARKMLDRQGAELKKRGLLQTYRENYIPRHWVFDEDEAGSKGVSGSRRPLEGTKTGLKQRTYEFARDARAAGAKPLFPNPIENLLYSLHDMEKLITTHDFKTWAVPAGRIMRVPVFGDKPPEDWVKLKDRAFTEYGPPTVAVREAFDARIRGALIEKLRDLGVTHEREVGIGGTRLGYALGENKIVTRFGGPDGVIMHELGHTLDARYKLFDELVPPAPKGKMSKESRAQIVAERKQLMGELRALADMRYEGMEPDPEFKDYVRERPEQIANAVHALMYAPELMQKVAPTIKAKLTGFLRARPELKDLLDIKPSLVVGSDVAQQSVGGLVTVADHYAPKPLATLINNYLDPGLGGKPLYDVYRGAGSLMTQLKLGLSAFHAMFTMLDAGSSLMSHGLMEMTQGASEGSASRIGEGLKTFGASLVPGLPQAKALRLGAKLKAAALRPEGLTPAMQSMVNYLVDAGGRVAMERGYGTGAWNGLVKALDQHRPLKAGALLVPGLLEAAASPIMKKLVPTLKLGVFFDRAQFELSRLPVDASEDEQLRVLARAWDDVDDRLGQFTYTNRFWNPVIRDVGFASVQALGWHVGAARAIGGGALESRHLLSPREDPRLPPPGGEGAPDAKMPGERLTSRAAWLISTVAYIGYMGGLYQWLRSGIQPESVQDLFEPRTGKRNADGTWERKILASYVMRDMYNLATEGPGALVGALNPAWQSIYDWIHNRDYRGRMIRNPDDPTMKQAMQELHHLLEQNKPLGVTGDAEQFFGITPAKQRMTRSAAENMAHDYLGRHGSTALTPEEGEDNDARRALLARLRAGDKTARTDMEKMVRGGELTMRQAQSLERRAAEAPEVGWFKPLTPQEAENVFAVATPAEKKVLGPWMQRKRAEGRVAAQRR